MPQDRCPRQPPGLLRAADSARPKPLAPNVSRAAGGRAQPSGRCGAVIRAAHARRNVAGSRPLSHRADSVRAGDRGSANSGCCLSFSRILGRTHRSERRVAAGTRGRAQTPARMRRSRQVLGRRRSARSARRQPPRRKVGRPGWHWSRWTSGCTRPGRKLTTRPASSRPTAGCDSVAGTGAEAMKPAALLRNASLRSAAK